MRRIAALLFAVFAAFPAAAEDVYPGHPITLITPYPPGGATDILDDHGLVQPRPQPLGKRARQEVGGAARRVRRDQGNGMAGIDVLGRRRKHGKDSEKQSRDAAHRFPPSSSWARCWAKQPVFTSATKGVSLPDEAQPMKLAP